MAVGPWRMLCVKVSIIKLNMSHFHNNCYLKHLKYLLQGSIMLEVSKDMNVESFHRHLFNSTFLGPYSECILAARFFKQIPAPESQ